LAENDAETHSPKVERIMPNREKQHLLTFIAYLLLNFYFHILKKTGLSSKLSAEATAYFSADAAEPSSWRTLFLFFADKNTTLHSSNCKNRNNNGRLPQQAKAQQSWSPYNDNDKRKEKKRKEKSQ
jgi:hypothetical protein